MTKFTIAAIAFIVGLVFGAAVTAPLKAHAAVGPAAPLAAACDSEAQVREAFDGSDFVAWHLTPAGSEKLNAFFTDLFGPPDKPLDSVWLVYIPTDDAAGFALFGPDGCGVDLLFPFSGDEANKVLDHVGIPSPIGSTYHQLPGSPGALPGFSAGPSI